MPTLTPAEQRAAAAEAAEAIVTEAKTANRDLTDDEVTKMKGYLATIDEVDAKAARSKETAGLLQKLAEINAGRERDGLQPITGGFAKDIGDHFVKSAAFKEMCERKGSRFSVAAPEYKAATDPLLSTDLGQTQYGKVVESPLRRPVVADLLAPGTMSGTSLTYWTQGTVEGDFDTVAEAGTKPSIHFQFGPVTEAPAKIAGITKISDEMSEDAPYIESVVRAQLLLRLALREEAQLLSGSGTAPNLRGLLNRTGVQTETAASAADNLDAVFRAGTKVQTVSELAADGVVIHPTDYQAMRLSKDGNDQYYGGGPFTGAYGNDGLQRQPGVWGYRTVVTSAITQGTVLVGAYAAAAQVFRKGGVRLEATNSNEDDFKKNLIALRAEERLGLAVYIPTAFCKVTLA